MVVQLLRSLELPRRSIAISLGVHLLLFFLIQVGDGLVENRAESYGRCVVFGDEDYEGATKVPNECRAFFGPASELPQYAYYVPQGYNTTAIKVP